MPILIFFCVQHLNFYKKVRRSLRELYEKLSKNREKYAAGGDSEDIASIIKEANDVLRDVKGTQEAMEDAKMFKLLCQTVLKTHNYGINWR